MASFQEKSPEIGIVQGGSAKFSPSGRLIAATAGSKIAVYRNSNPVERIHIYACIDKIEYFEFSPDENFILCALYSRNCVQVFSTSDTNWKCRINEGPAGIISAGWVPDSQSVITESDFGIQLSIWSLIDNSQSVITFPKPVTKMHSAMATFNRASSSTVAFADNKQFMAVVHRIELQDHIGIYSLNPLLEVNKFRARTSDVAMIQWLPYDTHIITIDAPLFYKCAIYSPTGEMMTCFEAYQNALGIRCLGIFRPPYSFSSTAWSSDPSMAVAADSVLTTSNLLAIGSFDSKIRLMTMFTWQVVLTLPLLHPRDLEVGLVDPDHPVITKVELSKLEQRDMIEVISMESLTQASINAGSVDRTAALSGSSVSTPTAISPYVTRMVKLLPKSSNPGANTALVVDSSHTANGGNTSGKVAGKASTSSNVKDNSNVITVTSAVDGVSLPAMGVHWLHWSATRTYLAASDEAYARCIWIWKPLDGKLIDLLIQLENVSSAAWRPFQSKANSLGRQPSDAESTVVDEHPSSITDSKVPDVDKSTASISVTEKWEDDVLAFVCHGQHVYLWSSGALGVRKIEVVNSQDAGRMKIRSVEWSQDGSALLLRGKDVFATVYVSPAGNIV